MNQHIICHLYALNNLTSGFLESLIFLSYHRTPTASDQPGLSCTSTGAFPTKRSATSSASFTKTASPTSTPASSGSSPRSPAESSSSLASPSRPPSRLPDNSNLTAIENSRTRSRFKFSIRWPSRSRRCRRTSS